ncbi:MAG: quinolinate synthase NadA [Arenicellales bacterium]|nr:quinolinate synthase NadA [Arenicellales bacterium]
MVINEDTVKALLAAAAPLIELAITEDIGIGDATSEAIVPVDKQLTGRFIAKQRGTVAGLPVVEALLKKVDPRLEFEACVEEGSPVEPGELIATATGPGRALLSAERAALNFLQRLSGIATLTKVFVDAVATTDTVILDTRKTLPGFRVLDKYAVRAGGGVNHRMGLYDMFLVKDNHIDAAGGPTPAALAAREARPDLALEIEVRNLDELEQALKLEPPPDRILLDNMDLDTLRKAVLHVGGQIPLEASGGVTIDNVAAIAATGVDAISVGELTHSASALDISMKTAATAVTMQSLIQEAQRLKSELDGRIAILGHHYQRDEVIELADFRGDSLGLARDATATDAEFIVFCGVHFMAETAAILAKPGQHVLLPDLEAGCYLAETVNTQSVDKTWQSLEKVLGNVEEQVLPVTYVNSSAELKSFCGRHGGIICTSGNAEAILRWAFEQRPKVLFFPDQHLGQNISRRLGVADEQMLVWDVQRPPDAEEIKAASVLLWPGACNVHRRFRENHIVMMRQRHPGIQIIVHPECCVEVVTLADDVGSTAHIIRRIDEAPPGTTWAVGTEARLVHRLQHRYPDKTVIPLADIPPYCSTMSQITLDKLVYLLDQVNRGKLHNEVVVDSKVSHWGRIALQRMLEQS